MYLYRREIGAWIYVQGCCPGIRENTEVVECHFTTGPYTMLIKLYARDNEHLMELLNSKIQEIPGVTATETLISLRQSVKREIPICNINE